MRITTLLEHSIPIFQRIVLNIGSQAKLYMDEEGYSANSEVLRQRGATNNSSSLCYYQLHIGLTDHGRAIEYIFNCCIFNRLQFRLTFSKYPAERKALTLQASFIFITFFDRQYLAVSKFPLFSAIILRLTG